MRLLRKAAAGPAGAEGAAVPTAGAACCSAGTARNMGCSMAIGNSVTTTLAFCRSPSSAPCTTSFASPAAAPHRSRPVSTAPQRLRMRRGGAAAAPGAERILGTASKSCTRLQPVLQRVAAVLRGEEFAGHARLL